MNDSNVIPFRKRPPTEVELDVYQHMTRGWAPELKELMFPEHFKREQEREARR